MGNTDYTASDVRQLWNDLDFLTERQQKLARSLIALGLSAVEHGDDQVKIELREPEDDGALDLSESFENLLTPGPLPAHQRPQGRKVGNTFAIELPRRDA